MMISWLAPILGIFLVDLILSGDNAIVIGVTASQLPRRHRMIAIVVGGGAAIVLRIVFALAATLLLQLRLIGIVGGIILLVITIRLLVQRSTERRSKSDESSPIVEPLSSEKKSQIVEPLSSGKKLQIVEPLSSKKKLQIVEPISNEKKPQTKPLPAKTDEPVKKRRARNNLLVSIITILLADVTMSLDNILAIGGLAAGNLLPLVIGLVFSIIFLLVGSALVAELCSRLPWLLDLACLILGWTAAQVFLADDVLNEFLPRIPWISSVAPAVVLVIVLIIDVILQMRDRRHSLRL
jgi:predicted tellurium resistance membrane protein TerC